MAIKINRNQRGLNVADFVDLSNEVCSLQESSIATENAVWLGINRPAPLIQINDEWKEIELPEKTVLTGRMHLSQQQVKDLLPALEYFAKYGKLPE